MFPQDGVIAQQPIRIQTYNNAGINGPRYLANSTDINFQPNQQTIPQNPRNNNANLSLQSPQAGILPGFNLPPGHQQPAQLPWCTNAAWPTATSVGCPRGLEYLATIDQIIVKQSKEVLEIVSGYETNNKYKIFNTMGQHIYTAQEDTDCCTRTCLGAARPFEISIFDMQREVLHVSRPFNFILQELEILAPCEDNISLGQIYQECTCCCACCCVPAFSVFDDTSEKVFSIDGPACGCNCCSDVDFVVRGNDGASEVGHIRKQWAGFVQESVTDADNFGITFPMDLDVKLKAVLLGATFLIDFIYFERSQQHDFSD